MGNIGLLFEGQILRELTDEGYTVIRSAASKTIDLAAYNKKETLFIEAKATRNRRPKSYAFDVLNTIKLCKQNGCRDKFYFVIRLYGNKQIWLKINDMTVDKKRTTYDIARSEAWVNRKRKMLKRKGIKLK